MYLEARAAASIIETQLGLNAAGMAALAARLRELRPRAILTCARGSSDHAATFARYLIATQLGLLTASVAPSITSVYGVPQQWHECVFLSISQSGRSPDLIAAAQAARAAGAHVIALVNAGGSPLAECAHDVIAMHAGLETSVAATKSYLASLSAIIQLVASWADNARLERSLRDAPELLRRAWDMEWSEALTPLSKATNAFVIGRGLGLTLAQEIALKLKETCGLHAEAFSAAELRHGPMALLRPGVPLLIVDQNDATHVGLEAVAREFAMRGVEVLYAGGIIAKQPGVTCLPCVAAPPLLAPLLQAQSFYRMANALAFARGLDPDAPLLLSKVTETV